MLPFMSTILSIVSQKVHTIRLHAVYCVLMNSGEVSRVLSGCHGYGRSVVVR